MKSLSLPFRFLAISGACAVLTASAWAQAPAAPATPAPGAAPAAPGKPLSPAEKNFVKNAGKSIVFLREVANSAKTVTLDKSVESYRDSVMKDMTKALEAIKKLGEAHGEVVPVDLAGSDKTSVERLGKLKDDKFTKQWIEELLKEGKKLAKDFESAEKTSQSEDVKMFAINYGPIARGVSSGGEKAQAALKKK